MRADARAATREYSSVRRGNGWSELAIVGTSKSAVGEPITGERSETIRAGESLLFGDEKGV
jgi:hypothetical protein